MLVLAAGTFASAGAVVDALVEEVVEVSGVVAGPAGFDGMAGPGVIGPLPG